MSEACALYSPFQGFERYWDTPIDYYRGGKANKAMLSGGPLLVNGDCDRRFRLAFNGNSEFRQDQNGGYSSDIDPDSALTRQYPAPDFRFPNQTLQPARPRIRANQLLLGLAGIGVFSLACTGPLNAAPFCLFSFAHSPVFAPCAISSAENTFRPVAC